MAKQTEPLNDSPAPASEPLGYPLLNAPRIADVLASSENLPSENSPLSGVAQEPSEKATKVGGGKHSAIPAGEEAPAKLAGATTKLAGATTGKSAKSKPAGTKSSTPRGSGKAKATPAAQATPKVVALKFLNWASLLWCWIV